MSTWIRQSRVRQWPANLFVFTLPLATGAFVRPAVLGRATIALLVFCLLTSGMHLLGDALEIDGGRRHRSERAQRSWGAIQTQELLIAAAGCLFTAIVSSGLAGSQLLAIALAYTVLTFSHMVWLRQSPVLDVVTLAACLALRALAGGAAAGLSGSSWLVALICVSALAVAAHRRGLLPGRAADLSERPEPARGPRPTAARAGRTRESPA